MRCSSCWKEIPFLGDVCPWCHADKRKDQWQQISAFLYGGVFGGVGWFLASLVSDSFGTEFLTAAAFMAVGIALGVFRPLGVRPSGPPQAEPQSVDATAQKPRKWYTTGSGSLLLIGGSWVVYFTIGAIQGSLFPGGSVGQRAFVHQWKELKSIYSKTDGNSGAHEQAGNDARTFFNKLDPVDDWACKIESVGNDTIKCKQSGATFYLKYETTQPDFFSELRVGNKVTFSGMRVGERSITVDGMFDDPEIDIDLSRIAVGGKSVEQPVSERGQQKRIDDLKTEQTRLEKEKDALEHPGDWAMKSWRCDMGEGIKYRFDLRPAGSRVSYSVNLMNADSDQGKMKITKTKRGTTKGRVIGEYGEATAEQIPYIEVWADSDLDVFRHFRLLKRKSDVEMYGELDGEIGGKAEGECH